MTIYQHDYVFRQNMNLRGWIITSYIYCVQIGWENEGMGVPKCSQEHVLYGSSLILTVTKLTPKSFRAINILKHA